MIRRGAVWTISGGPEYSSKPRPVVIIQDDAFSGTASITICPLTTDATEAPLMRVVVEPTPANGLRQQSRLMADKITTVSKAKLGDHVGDLSRQDMRQLDRALIVFLGLAG